MPRIKNACSVFSPPWPTSVKTQSYAFKIIPYFKRSTKIALHKEMCHPIGQTFYICLPYRVNLYNPKNFFLYPNFCRGILWPLASMVYSRS